MVWMWRLICLTILTTRYCLSIAAARMSLERMVEMFCLIVKMTVREVVKMIMRGRKKPVEKRKML